MSKTLLLADDSVTIQRVIELTFADEDIHVVAVGDGQQAIDRIKTDPPDIILADTGMPERDGYEVAAFVKGDPALAGIPVVLLTGAFEPLDERRARQIGADGVLVKPFEPQLVIDRVRALLETDRGLAAAEAITTGMESGAAGGPRSGQSAAAAEARQRASLPPETAAAGSLGAEELDEYFDQLDAAFANLDTTGNKARRPLGALWKDSVVDTTMAAGASVPQRAPVEPERDFGDWDLDALSRGQAEAGEGPAPPTPVDFPGSPEPPEDVRRQDAVVESVPWAQEVEVARAGPSRLAPEPPAAERTPEPTMPAARLSPVVPAPVEAAPLANAFAALLAAEQGVPGAGSAPGGWPSPVAPVVTDELVDDLAQRILERLTDRVIREAVADAVGGVAERLVREEIERIKAGAK